jgi:hypothetical protein
VYPKRYLEVDLALACERFGDGPLGQPANALTSLAFVLAGALILAGRRGSAGWRWPYALLVLAVGVGSVVQHGPHPPWQAYAHDLPLAGLLAFVAADAAADLTSRAWLRHWWLVVPAAMVPVVTAGPVASSVTQGVLAAVAIGLNLARARVRPPIAGTLYRAFAVLATGALVGALAERTPLCQPDSLWQGHAAWHLLAAVALWLLAPAVGSRGGPVVLVGGQRRLAAEAEPP